MCYDIIKILWYLLPKRGNADEHFRVGIRVKIRVRKVRIRVNVVY